MFKTGCRTNDHLCVFYADDSLSHLESHITIRRVMLLKVQVDALLSFLVVGWRNFPPNNFIQRVMGKKDSHS